VVDPTGSGEVSLGVLIRVLGSSRVPAPVIDKVKHLMCFEVTLSDRAQVVNLVSSKPRVSRLEFYVALALIGLAQEHEGWHIFRCIREFHLDG